jgi:hypothetical protein
MSVDSILKSKVPSDLVDALLNSYAKIEQNFALRKWKESELDAGHFVEASRRILEHALLGTYTPLNSQLSKFTDQIMQQYEHSSGDESFRILIPRALRAVYTIRNKRGAGHLGRFSANEMDCTYILYSCKWFLAELVRLASGLSPEETQVMVSKIVERQIEILWKEGDIVRILDGGLKVKQQILILLYDESPQSVDSLLQITEYSNSTTFRQNLKALHSERLIFCKNQECRIISKGIIEAEKILNRSKE